jgi:hypothetical protein
MGKLVSNREEVARMLEESYDGWVQEMKGRGWKYGKVVDFDKKESPYIVEYKELPLFTQTECLVFAHFLSDSARRRK